MKAINVNKLINWGNDYSTLPQAETTNIYKGLVSSNNGRVTVRNVGLLTLPGWKQYLTDDARVIVERLEDAIRDAEGRASARTLSVKDIVAALMQAAEPVGTKKALVGTMVHYDAGQSFPSSYKYKPCSTHFIAEYRATGWFIVDVFREACPNHSGKGSIIYSDAAKAAIIDRLQTLQ